MEAEEANQAKDEFFSVVSRELSAPLTTIIGWAHLLKRDKGTDRARLEHALDVIERSAQAQSRLVDDMIDMSRIAAGRLRVDMKAIDLGPLVRSCADEMRSAAASKGIDLELQSGPAAQATVVADAERFRQVMSVVLDHAFRCTPPGGHVRVEVEPQERVVLVRVVDDGRGLSADKLRKVFEPFTRHDAWAGPDGGGMTLGLPIAKYILEQHRGQLRVESEGAGHGVAITLELPRADPLAGMLAVSGGTRTSVAPLDGVRVLLVDDDPGAREALAETLAVEGAEVRPVPSAQAAIDQLGDYSPDVVVSNLVMSEGDNNAFMRRVRGLPSPVAAVPALALVDHAIPEGTARAAEAGFQRQLPKPPEPKALIQAVGQLAHRPD
jgi:CheY-like chemotaxis protein